MKNKLIKTILKQDKKELKEIIDNHKNLTKELYKISKIKY